VDRIMKTSLPRNWKALTINDDFTDLDKHIDVFVTQVNLYAMDDVVLY